jgi:hypothetical protein
MDVLQARVTETGLRASLLIDRGAATLQLWQTFLDSDVSVLDEQLFDYLCTSANAAFIAGGAFMKAVGKLLACVLIYALKLMILVSPHLLKLINVVIDFHRTQMDSSDIAVEIGILIFLLLFLLLHKRLKRAYDKFEARVKTRYKKASVYVPHVLFFTLATAVAFIGRKFLLPLASSNSTLPLLLIAAPLLQTVQWARTGQVSKYTPTLKYWIIASVYFVTSDLFLYVPFAKYVSGFFSPLNVFVLIVAVWIQCSAVCVNIVYDATSPLVLYYANKIPATEALGNYGSSFVGMLQMMRVIDSKKASFISRLLEDSMSVLIAVAFVMTPTWIANIGSLCIGFILPAFRSSKLVDPPQDSKDKQVALHFREQQVHWLEYWSCYFFLIAIRIMGFQILPNIMLIISLWLQHSYFAGASQVFLFLERNRKALVERHYNLPPITPAAKTSDTPAAVATPAHIASSPITHLNLGSTPSKAAAQDLASNDVSTPRIKVAVKESTPASESTRGGEDKQEQENRENLTEAPIKKINETDISGSAMSATPKTPLKRRKSKVSFESLTPEKS